MSLDAVHAGNVSILGEYDAEVARLELNLVDVSREERRVNLRVVFLRDGKVGNVGVAEGFLAAYYVVDIDEVLVRLESRLLVAALLLCCAVSAGSVPNAVLNENLACGNSGHDSRELLEKRAEVLVHRCVFLCVFNSSNNHFKGSFRV